MVLKKLKMDRKGIILAGGSGTRLHPLTIHTSKQLLPIYDKPMIYYPLCTLMSAGIKDILIISTPKDIKNYKILLGNGNQWGIKINYEIQPKPEGLAQALIIGDNFINNHPSVLILGDNFFYGSGLEQILTKVNEQKEGAHVFAYSVKDPERYGVVEFDENDKVISIEEKPETPKSNFAVPGLYFYDNDVIEIAKSLDPSPRGEFEITDINKHYLNKEKLKVKTLPRGVAWLDTGTFSSLMQASHFVQTIEERQGVGVGCIEAVAFSNGFINEEQLEELSIPLLKSGYGNYLKSLIK